MNMFPPLTTLRSFVSYQFSLLRMRALRDRLWGKIVGFRTELIVFPGDNARLSPSRRLIGIKNIRVADVVGTLNRETDFDSQFRPLKKHTLSRWVNAYILQEQDAWSPILVHKVRDEYFVEDGHHRISVARALGMDFIEAKVWEYAQLTKTVRKCIPSGCVEKRPAKAYVTG